MKVFGITCGRKNGNSEILMKQAFMALEEKGIETGFVRLLDAYIKPCTGCETCMVHHLKGDNDFRCVFSKESDHFYAIEQQMREADAIIVSAPVYNLMPPGILITFLNKLHASGDYRYKTFTNPKLAAVISIGGTDWTNLGMPIATLCATSLTGGTRTLVDQLDVTFHPSSGSVLVDDEAMGKAYKLGENVAAALLTGKRDNVYIGAPKACKTCLGNLLEYRNGELWCPICEMPAEVSVVDGKVKIDFTEDAKNHSRFSPWGGKLHNDNIMKGHKMASDNIETINARRKKYIAFKDAIVLPELKK